MKVCHADFSARVYDHNQQVEQAEAEGLTQAQSVNKCLVAMDTWI